MTKQEIEISERDQLKKEGNVSTVCIIKTFQGSQEQKIENFLLSVQSEENRREVCLRFWLRLRHPVILI